MLRATLADHNRNRSAIQDYNGLTPDTPLPDHGVSAKVATHAGQFDARQQEAEKEVAFTHGAIAAVFAIKQDTESSIAQFFNLGYSSSDALSIITNAASKDDNLKQLIFDIGEGKVSLDDKDVRSSVNQYFAQYKSENNEEGGLAEFAKRIRNNENAYLPKE